MLCLNDTYFLEAILKNPRCGGKTKKDIEIAIEKWFNGAKDRDGGRENRRKLKQGLSRHKESEDPS